WPRAGGALLGPDEERAERVAPSRRIVRVRAAGKRRFLLLEKRLARLGGGRRGGPGSGRRRRLRRSLRDRDGGRRQESHDDEEPSHSTPLPSARDFRVCALEAAGGVRRPAGPPGFAPGAPVA